MKWVFVLLLAANFAYLGWQMQQGDQKALAQQPAASSPPPETGNLKLLSELNQLPPTRNGVDEDQTAQAAPASQTTPSDETEPDTPVVPGNCFTIGPFESKDDAEGFRSKQLADRVSKISERPDDDLKKKLFWVYLAAQTSAQMAREKLQDLQRQGVKDYMLIQKGGLKNAISLGMFSSQESVNRRLAELGKKGYQPVVVPRYQAQKAYWIDLKLGIDESLPQPVTDALPGGVQANSAACSKIALAPTQP